MGVSVCYVKRLFVIVLLIISVFSLKTFAQQAGGKLITGNFNSLTITQFATQLEKQTSYHFYFDTVQFVKFKITANPVNQTLNKLLDQVFQNTDYKYVVDSRNNVFITKGQEISINLPGDILEIAGSAATPASATARIKLADLTNKKLIPKAAQINKIYDLGIKTAQVVAGMVKISGYVTAIANGKPVAGATITSLKSRTNTLTDNNGFYSLNISTGKDQLFIKSVEMEPTSRQIMVYGNGRLDIDLFDNIQQLKEVLVAGNRVANVESAQMGLERIDIKSIKQVPTAFGEADVLRAVLTLPGVQSVGEASTGLNVRGGAVDQTLILFNGMTIFNPTHFFGFFSSFNSEIVKDVELYKSSIPAQYGGRVSSVLDVSMREGDMNKFHGSAGIGLITSRLNVEGPLVKDKVSFNFGARTTYSNWVTKLLPDKADYKNSKADFRDFTLALTAKVDSNNTLYFTGLYSYDFSNLNSDTSYNYRNKNEAIKLRHTFGRKLNSFFSLGYDGYGYNNYSNAIPGNGYNLNFNVNQTYLKADFIYRYKPRHNVKFGASSIYYMLNPGTYTPLGSGSLVAPQTINAEKALETALYLSDEYRVTPKLTLDMGIRYLIYNYLGSQKVYTYAPGLPLEAGNVTDSTSYSSGSIVNTYHAPEFRISARYLLSTDLSLKASFNTLRQYIHILSSTNAVAPTDIWKLSDPYIKPTYGNQLSLGLYRNFKDNEIETSVEGYYKQLKNYLDYKSGATIVLNPTIERDVINTRGKAYGVELMVKKNTGRVNGWINYTYARTMLKSDTQTGETVNGGKYYSSAYDKPHTFNFIGNYRVSERFNFSVTTIYSTGRPVTVPVGQYYFNGSARTFYSERNGYRIPDYFRSDISITRSGNHKVKQLIHNSFTLGVYNLTGRKNVYSTYFISQNGVVNGYKLSVFGNAIPYISYNITF